MKKIIIDGQVFWYNVKICMLFYDYKMKAQVPTSIFTKTQYRQFLDQLNINQLKGRVNNYITEMKETINKLKK